VKIFQENRNDRYQIIYLAKEDSFIGLTSIFGDEFYHNSASSVGKSEIWNMDLTVFRNLMLTNGKFATKMLEMLCKETLFINQRLLGQISKQLPGRIADVLLYFSEVIYGSPEFEVPLTRKELAELSGTTKESFIRTLTEFKNDKIIEINGSNIKIKSMEIIRTLHNLG
jgi:CRP-like cAMP-binding protein